MKRRWVFNVIAVIIVLAGAAALFYPMISNHLYQQSQQELAEYYENLTEEMPQEQIDEMRIACDEYNESLRSQVVQLTDPFDENAYSLEEHPYVDLLNPDGDGAMGSLEIPAIGCRLVIYHGTGSDVLAKGIGHLQGTSLPVGGIGTHAVLSGHTGTSDKKLFTDLDRLKTGDVFYIHVLGDTLAYQVDQILVVLPNETDSLVIDREQDYVTLVTCTPYGINSHRLLVRGHRIPYEEAKSAEESAGNAGSTWASQYLRAILAGIALALLIAAVVLIVRRILQKRRT